MIQVGDPRSLRACQVRVLSLTQFLEKDWTQESQAWLMNSTLQLAAAAAMLARKEVAAAAELGDDLHRVTVTERSRSLNA